MSSEIRWGIGEEGKGKKRGVNDRSAEIVCTADDRQE